MPEAMISAQVIITSTCLYWATAGSVVIVLKINAAPATI